MPDRNQPTQQSADLHDLIFSAKVDYITIATTGKTKLPSLSGKPKWPMNLNGLVLTVHDATASDIDILISVFGPAKLLELEIAVDVRPGYHATAEESETLLSAVMVDVFARGLDPSAGQDMAKGFRAVYRHRGAFGSVRPFNRRLPLPTDQQLHGGRGDAVQVKAYLKTRDQGMVLAPNKQVARVEVRLGSAGLYGHGLTTLNDIAGFKFRKNLMPYFRHIAGTRPAAPRSGVARTLLLKLLTNLKHKPDQENFARVGVGAFLPGGGSAGAKVVFLRNVPVNNRLGQALTRLEERFDKNNFVQHGNGGFQESPMLARRSGGLDQSRMTI